ncbi:MAG: hypothetical protein HOP08_11755 [Cyclobacteriaceae bacterium]|nr:hypothetical protein [Cyclobacteriaceae bacterium]
MKRHLFVLCVLSFGISFSSVGQVDSLIMHKTFGGARFEYKKDTSVFIVSPKQVLDIMKNDAEALAEFKKAKSNYGASGVIGFIGGALIGFPVGTAIAGGQPEWGLAAGGAALLLIAVIPLDKAFKRHSENALNIYNRKHNTAFRPRTNYFLSGLGLKVIIKF